ncbi:MAG: glycosyltransferase [Candidatus Absconditabacterales bacterium]|jgi:glycosyltransferase involved in cell wall biosynthesis
MLKSFIDNNCNSFILSVSEKSKSKKSKKIYGLGSETLEGIRIKKYFVEKPLDKNNNEAVMAVRILLKKYRPKIVIVNTPAVFFNSFHALAVKEVISTGARVMTIVSDELFPTSQNYPKKEIEEYYELINKGSVYAISNRIADRLREVKVVANKFPQLFDFDKIISKKRNPRYITMINRHPIKGISIFNKIARKMTHESFLLVESWPDVPRWKKKCKNVRFIKFNKNVKNIYEKTRILLVPSLCKEGIARVVIESMMNGIPVIANRIGSLPEIDTKFINFVEPPKKIKYKLNKTILYPEVGKNELNRIVDEYVKIINKIKNGDNKNYDDSKKIALKYANGNKVKFEKIIKSLLR